METPIPTWATTTASEFTWTTWRGRIPSGNQEQPNNKLVVFYGFNGMLAQKYSVTEKSREEITARLEASKNKVPYSIKDYESFQVVIEQMQDISPLVEIGFDDAMNIIRIGMEKLTVEEFKDAEEDEFDNNCVPGCKPGNHACGK